MKYKKGDVILLLERNGVNRSVVVVCGSPAKGQYSVLPIDEYIVALSWTKDPALSPSRRRLAESYIDNTATYLGADLENIRILYG